MGFVDAVKDFVGFGDIDDYEDEMEMMEEEEIVEERAPLFSRKNKVVALDRAAQPSIVVLKPKCFNNTTEVADQIKMRRPVVIDVGNLDPEEARRVVDFVTGTVYGLNGDIQKVSGGIFIATPASYAISGEILKDKSGAGFDWSMFK